MDGNDEVDTWVDSGSVGCDAEMIGGARAEKETWFMQSLASGCRGIDEGACERFSWCFFAPEQPPSSMQCFRQCWRVHWGCMCVNMQPFLAQVVVEEIKTGVKVKGVIVLSREGSDGIVMSVARIGGPGGKEANGTTGEDAGVEVGKFLGVTHQKYLHFTPSSRMWSQEANERPTLPFLFCLQT